MSRKISEQAANAFLTNNSFRLDNTKVVTDINVTKLYLHGNVIAVKENGIVKITTAGWNTSVTKERLNALGVSVSTKKGQLYLNGKEWDGKLKEVTI